MGEEVEELIAGLNDDATWLEGVAEGGDDARIVARLRRAARVIKELASCKAERAKRDAAILEAIEGERLHDATGEQDDVAYEYAIDCVLKALKPLGISRATSAEGKPNE